jgi:hypothetical protein
MVDDQNFDWAFGGFERKTELIPHRGEEKLACAIGFGLRPIHLAVVSAFEASLVDHGTTFELGLVAKRRDDEPKRPALGAQVQGLHESPLLGG